MGRAFEKLGDMILEMLCLLMLMGIIAVAFPVVFFIEWFKK